MKVLSSYSALSYISIIDKYVLAIIFMVSGVSKLFYIEGFAMEVREFSEMYFSSILVSWTNVIATGVCLTEITLAITLCITRISFVATIMTLLMMTSFLCLTGINYLRPPITGSIQSCGCFGELIHFTARGSFIKSAFLWTIALITLLSNSRFRQTLLQIKRRVIRKAK